MLDPTTSLPLMLKCSARQQLSVLRDCAIITWRGLGKLEGGGGIGENDNKREGGLDVKFNTYGGALIFHSFLQTGKVVEEVLEFKYKY